MIKRTIKFFLAVALAVTALAGPVRQAQAADLAFPILFVPVWSQNEFIPGPNVFTDTRITIFESGLPIPLPIVGFDVLVLIFDRNEVLIGFPSIPMTPWDVEVLTGNTGLPNGTGTIVLVNTFAGFNPPILAAAFPITAVTEIGVKAAAGGQLDPVPAGFITSVIANEAQFIPAVAGEFPRVEVTTTAADPGVPLFFPGNGFETIIVETCLLPGVVHNYYVDDDENFLFDRAIICTGIHIGVVAGTAILFGPDLLITTPDDGGLLGTVAAAQSIPQDTSAPPVPADYHLMAVDVNTFGGPLAPFGETFFHGQAAVYLPTFNGTKEAYSYNMPANYFGTRLFTPNTTCIDGLSCVNEALGFLNWSINDLLARVCMALGPNDQDPLTPPTGANLVDCNATVLP